MFIVHAFINYTITVAVWTSFSFHVRRFRHCQPTSGQSPSAGNKTGIRSCILLARSLALVIIIVHDFKGSASGDDPTLIDRRYCSAQVNSARELLAQLSGTARQSRGQISRLVKRPHIACFGASGRKYRLGAASA